MKVHGRFFRMMKHATLSTRKKLLHEIEKKAKLHNNVSIFGETKFIKLYTISTIHFSATFNWQLYQLRLIILAEGVAVYTLNSLVAIVGWNSSFVLSSFMCTDRIDGSVEDEYPSLPDTPICTFICTSILSSPPSTAAFLWCSVKS